MPIYHVKSSSSTPVPNENWMIWFSGTGIEDCNNALLLYGSGDILLLKTERTIERSELDKLDFENWTTEDYEKWKEIFGTGAASNELRDAYRHFRRVNDHL